MFGTSRGFASCSATRQVARDEENSARILVPAPFVIACPSGHLDDFPWRLYAHRGDPACQRRLTFRSTGQTGSVMDLRISCECGSGNRSVSDAFGIGGTDEIGPCPGTRPWLPGIGPEPCSTAEEVRTIQRGATNGWFPMVQSALAIKESASPIGDALRSIRPRQLASITERDQLELFLTQFPGMFPSLAPFAGDVDDVWRHIRIMRGEEAVDVDDLRRPEWEVLRDPIAAQVEQSELVLEEGEVPSQFAGLIERVVLARKLLEVRALTGFTRLDTTIPGLSAESESAHSATDGLWRQLVARRRGTG